MFNISLDVDYLNIYRRDQNLPLSDEEDIIITKGLERACDLFRDFDFRATFFLVGDSIGRYRSDYLKLLEEGHEIGNHTMNHLNLLELSAEEQSAQVSKCQEAIKNDLNYQSIGFKAPGYNMSQALYGILSKNDIKYDTSLFSNILLPLAKLLFFMRSGKSGFGNIGQMFKTGRIHKKGDLFIVPVGSTVFKLPFYGSFHAMYPALAELGPVGHAFTYLMHPIEFLENREISGLKTGFRTTLRERIGIYRQIFGKLKGSRRRCLILKDLIEKVEG